MIFFSNSPDETMWLGERLGRLLKPGSVVCLEGDLGAGKTHFAKGVARGLGVNAHVTSPTFTLINEYEGRLPLFHMDAYRLEEAEEAYELGLEEYLYGMGTTLVEWPDRVMELLPQEHLTVRLECAGDNNESRRIQVSSTSPVYDKLIKELSASVCPGN